jgi:hypothetical protein
MNITKYSKEITLIHGFKNRENGLFKKIQIRALNGFDEEFLNTLEMENGINLPYPIKTNMLLSRVINIFDGNDHYKKYNESEKLDILKKMTIGDRVYMILYLRKLTFGDTFQIDIPCDSCRNLMSIDLSIDTIINNSLVTQNKVYCEYVSNIQTDNDFFYKCKISNSEVIIRLLNGLDQENISLNNINETELLGSCIVNLDLIGHEKLLDEDFRSKINSAFSALDPLSDILLTIVCPSCNNIFKIPFIIEDFIFKEIKSRFNNLEIDIHWLALNYHWTESNILSLPIPKRKRYLQLVRNTLEGEIDYG